MPIPFQTDWQIIYARVKQLIMFSGVLTYAKILMCDWGLFAFYLYLCSRKRINFDSE